MEIWWLAIYFIVIIVVAAADEDDRFERKCKCWIFREIVCSCHMRKSIHGRSLSAHTILCDKFTAHDGHCSNVCERCQKLFGFFFCRWKMIYVQHKHQYGAADKTRRHSKQVHFSSHFFILLFAFCVANRRQDFEFISMEMRINKSFAFYFCFVYIKTNRYGKNEETKRSGILS